MAQASWVNMLDKVFLAMMWWVIPMALLLWLPFTRPFWWVFLPIFLSIELRKLYRWWIAWDFSYAKTKWAMIEMIPPKEVLIPVKAMEDVFSTMWSPLYDTANWREIWCEGELPETPYWMSFEIVSIEGELHFYARVMQAHRPFLESVLYSHYPDIEIHEVQDYTNDVPHNMPNKEWNVYGEDFVLKKPNPYPIKTYEAFFEPQGERISAEEKRIDPMNSLLESMSKLGSGEQYWMQFIFMGTSDKFDPQFKKETEKIISDLSKRPAPKKKKGLADELAQIGNDVIFGPKKEVSGDKVTYKWIRSEEAESEGEREMVLTPGEREIMLAVENKVKKPVFRTVIRGMYMAKRENWHSSNRVIARPFVTHFITKNLNYISFESASRPKTHYFFRKRIPLARSRRMLRNYISRLTPFFPDRRQGTSIFNTEEMATLFHFPFKITSSNLPSMSRVDSRKGGPPSNLPIK